MDDLINRKIAYSMLSEYYHHKTDMQHKALWDALSRVPSAEPECYMVKMDEATDIEILKGILSKPSEIVIIPMTKAETPRKKGKWMHKHKIYGVAYCSECDYELHIDNASFCPNCGADMRGEDETD